MRSNEELRLLRTRWREAEHHLDVTSWTAERAPAVRTFTAK